VPLELGFDPDIVRHRLERLDTAPCLLGLSGGGDSTALLLIAAGWARDCGIALIPVIIDHAIRAESADEARRAAQRARELGLSPVIIRWEGAKPATGLQAAARDFRLKTFASIAHQHDANTVLLGHTLEDQAETVWMRLQAGGGPGALSAMAMHSALPLWPEGRGLSIFRPMLDISRAQLRAWLTQQGESWVDDPSNDSRAYTRVRNRQTLARLAKDGFDINALCAMAGEFQAAHNRAADTAAKGVLQHLTLLPWGGLRLHREWASTTGGSALKIMDAARAAASGDPASRPDASRRLLEALQAGKPATAGGAALTFHTGNVYLVRDPGAVSGRADNTARPPRLTGAGKLRIWDGRYAILLPDASVSLLGKDYPQEIKSEILTGIPPLARSGLPLIRQTGGNICLPGLMGEARGLAISLATELVCRNLFENRPPAWFDVQLRGETAQGSQ